MNQITVTHFKNHTDNLFEFTTTRPIDFRFRAGEFVMLTQDDITRPYSIGSPTYSETLTWLSVVAPGGEFTAKLRNIKPGDTLMMGKKAVGSLVFDNLISFRRDLYLLATGTGITPWASIIGDEEVLQYRNVIIIHSVKFEKELVWEERLHELYANWIADDYFTYIPVVTQDFKNERIQYQRKFKPSSNHGDQVMVCGNLSFVNDMRNIMAEKGFTNGSANMPGNFLYEKAFVS